MINDEGFMQGGGAVLSPSFKQCSMLDFEFLVKLGKNYNKSLTYEADRTCVTGNNKSAPRPLRW
jgi:hypothetical protein